MFKKKIPHDRKTHVHGFSDIREGSTKIISRVPHIKLGYRFFSPFSRDL